MRIALVQMHSSTNLEENLKKMYFFAESAKEKKADLVVFPENCTVLGKNRTVRAAAEKLDLADLTSICHNLSITAVFGGIPIIEKGNVLNRSIFVDKRGLILAKYDKIHLFFLNTGKKVIDERTLYKAGDKPVRFEWNGWKIGMSICYDLRFPELYAEYLGCDLILCTAAFTYQTGKPHWHTLINARAIENQCYMAGVNQVGENEENSVKMFGGTVLYNAWGEKVAESADCEQLVITDIEAKDNLVFRNRVPALRDRMNNNNTMTKPLICGEEQAIYE